MTIDKERERAKYKAYNDTHKEQRKAHYQANKERISQRKKAYNETNKEKARQRHKAWYEANKEQVKQQRKAHYQANKEQVKQQSRAYRQTNREKVGRASDMIEEQEFIKLYKQWYNPIHRYIQSRGLSPEISEELTQDVFMAVWKYLDTLNTQYNVKNWLYTIAHNKVIDYHRGKAWKNDTCLPISEDGHFAIGPD